ncbi:MAG TPA: hypothetical protein VKV15_07425 [Bryobacteraceae bacterium]|nr:hypothetical protein [Bryobacteraceae bacterium]
MHPGLRNQELAKAINGPNAVQQPVNAVCHRLEEQGILERRKRTDGLIGNHLLDPNSRGPGGKV